MGLTTFAFACSLAQALPRRRQLGYRVPEIEVSGIAARHSRVGERSGSKALARWIGDKRRTAID